MKDPKLIETGLDNVFILVSDGKRLATKSLIRYEKPAIIGKEEYRIWDPYHSKLAAMILKGASIPIKRDSEVLYLGAANGTTVSHVSDIVSLGTVFAVEFSPRAMRDLIRVSAPRTNLIPILADAQHPGSYRTLVSGVDVIYQDIAQREQAVTAIRNAKLYLKKDGFLILIIKPKSIDSTKKTKDVTDSEIKKLETFFNVMEFIDLEPFHSDHIAVVAQRLIALTRSTERL